jgi:serine/threonine protein kinase/formylglycine-generating enzyme required for sulfatase activity
MPDHTSPTPDRPTVVAPSAPTTGHHAQSTATDALMAKLAQAPKFDEQRFLLEGELGKGGMGVVMQVLDQHLNRRLAMKLLLEQRAPEDDDDRKLARQLLGRFLEEAQVTSQLDHPGVVPVHELGLDQRGKVYFTMRMVSGRTASEVFADALAQRDDWTPTRALEVVLKVCDTMSYAHDKGVLHRDLKPANVMVGRFGEVYVMDWGLAKVTGQPDRHEPLWRSDEAVPVRLATVRQRDAAADASSSVVSMDGQRVGTPCYMSPEQARGEPLDARTDVYAIGAMLYQLLTGSAPYMPRGLRKPAHELLADVRQGPPLRVEALRQDVPAELVAIVDKAMARDPVQRYASAAALATDLRAYLGQRVVSAYRTGALVELKLWVRRNKPLAASLLAAAGILVAGIVGTTWLANANAALAAEKGELAAAETKARGEAQQRAEENAKLAAEKGALAESEGRAKAESQRTVANFNQLSAVVRLKDVLAQQEALWPAGPDQVKALAAWLAGPCQQLLDQRPQIEATIAALRARALPWTPEQVAVDRRASPEYAVFERQQQVVAVLRRAQALRAGASKLEVPDLPAALQDADASALNSFAWPRVAPEQASGEAPQRTTFGEEAVALVAARAAVAKSTGTNAAFEFLDTLAWAALANGQDGEATQATASALAQAPKEERAAYEGYQRDIAAAIAEAPARLAAAEAKLTELDAAVSVRRTWTFGTDEDSESARFLHAALVDVVAGLDGLAKRERADVAQRLAWAQQVASASAGHPKARVTWAAAREAIAKADGVVASELYAGRGIVIPDGGWVGLVPIGMNPVTKMWEFYDLRSAWDGEQAASEIAIPTHAADGSIQVQAGTGIVFVLLPGGTVTLGSQKDDPNAPYYDPQRLDDETLHEVTLSPFLLARHELTQGQWSRLWTWDAELRDPSQYKAGQNLVGKQITLANPVEQVDWGMCDRLLTRHGMALPTEAQWEYGCRGGTTTAWNVAFEQLQQVANLADAGAKAAAPQWGAFESWRDGHVVHAPVGTFAANAFGLHDVHGNVVEWCRDWYGDYGNERAGDGLRSVSSPAYRVFRGGSYGDPAADARAAGRFHSAPSVRSSYLGLRPSRIITF